MKILLVGVGGIGGYIGSKLLSSTEKHNTEVYFLQRGEHYEQIKKNGLLYKSKTEKTVFPTAIYQNGENIPEMDMILFSVKSKDLETSALSIKKAIGKTTMLATVLNGVNNAERLKKIYPDTTVLNGCIYISAFIEKPGVVVQKGGAGAMILGEKPFAENRHKDIYDMFTQAGIHFSLSPHIELDVWKKYLLISSLATITSAKNATFGEVNNNDTLKKDWIKLLHEILELAQKKNIALTNSDIESCIEKIKHIPVHAKTSMHIDVENGKYPEIDIFTKYIVEESEKYGLSAESHKKYYADLIKIIEVGGYKV